MLWRRSASAGTPQRMPHRQAPAPGSMKSQWLAPPSRRCRSGGSCSAAPASKPWSRSLLQDWAGASSNSTGMRIRRSSSGETARLRVPGRPAEKTASHPTSAATGPRDAARNAVSPPAEWPTSTMGPAAPNGPRPGSRCASPPSFSQPSRATTPATRSSVFGEKSAKWSCGTTTVHPLPAKYRAFSACPSLLCMKPCSRTSVRRLDGDAEIGGTQTSNPSGAGRPCGSGSLDSDTQPSTEHTEIRPRSNATTVRAYRPAVPHPHG